MFKPLPQRIDGMCIGSALGLVDVIYKGTGILIVLGSLYGAANLRHADESLVT